jgi:hypothetical protein
MPRSVSRFGKIYVVKVCKIYSKLMSLRSRYAPDLCHILVRVVDIQEPYQIITKLRDRPQ